MSGGARGGEAYRVRGPTTYTPGGGAGSVYAYDTAKQKQGSVVRHRDDGEVLLFTVNTTPPRANFQSSVAPQQPLQLQYQTTRVLGTSRRGLSNAAPLGAETHLAVWG